MHTEIIFGRRSQTSILLNVALLKVQRCKLSTLVSIDLVLIKADLTSDN
jgi:hypothetical protein